MTEGELPARLGRYRIVRRLGTGGMAEVFLAKSAGAEGIEKTLVLKRILPTFSRSAKFITMFVDEAKVAMRLNHPNIVQVYAFEQVQDEFLLAMEYVDGIDLGRLVSTARKNKQRLPFGLGAYIVMEVAKGLDYAHKRKDELGEPLEIVHRDVSPQNVLLSYEGVVKVADFGIAKARLVSEDTGIIKGKFGYMSPEQSRGERVDRRSDVYALGVLLCELLMGRTMYRGFQGLEILEEVRKGNVKYPRDVDPAVPDELDRIARRAIAFDPEERFQSARAFAMALSQYLHLEEEMHDADELERFIVQAGAQRPGTVGERVSLVPPQPMTGVSQSVQRERRYVVVVAGIAREPREPEGSQPSIESRGIGAEAARMLADIAFKADAVLVWPDEIGGAHFRLILGLGRASLNDPLEAVRLALDVLEALHGLSADLLVPVTASLGVSRGVVSTVRDQIGRLLHFEPVGTVLEVADQLADAGRPGEVLAAGEVHRLVRRGFAFENEVREIDVETDAGSSVGLRAYRVLGVRSREDRAAEAMASAEGSKLVGRNAEIQQLVDLYGAVRAQNRLSFVTVVGELGVGKSALVAAALEVFSPAPQILRSECAFGTTDTPFAATADLVRDACHLPDDCTADEARRMIDEALGVDSIGSHKRGLLMRGLLPLVAVDHDSGEVASVEGRDRAFGIMKSVEYLIEVLAKRGPLVLSIDSFQWIDRPSLEMVRVMLQRRYTVPVLVILATRPDSRVERSLSGSARVEVAELGPEERRHLIRSRFGDVQVPTDIEGAILDRAGGNPFFIGELVDSLLERKVVTIVGEDDERRVVRRAGAQIALPTTLEGVLAARLGELPEIQRRALRWLGVAGVGLRGPDLSALAGVDLEPALHDLEQRGLVQQRSGGGYSFPSAVVRHVAYETIDATDRERMHRAIARYLATQPAVSPARIARHLERGGNPEQAAFAYLQAADRARGVYSNSEALRFYAQSLNLLPPDSPQRFHAHEAREQILMGMGRRNERSHELEAMLALATAIGEPGPTALSYNRLARFKLDCLETTGVAALLQRALQAARDGSDRGAEVEALRLRAQCAREDGDHRAALESCDLALSRASLDSGLLAARGSVLVQRALALRSIGRLEESLEALAEAVVIFRRLRLKRNESIALNALGISLASVGDFEDAISMFRASLLIDREIGDRFFLGRKLSNVGQLYGYLGDIDRSFKFLRRALDLYQSLRDERGQCDTLISMAETLLEGTGDINTAVYHLDDARRIALDTGDRYNLARERIVRTRVEQINDRHGEAADCAREALQAAGDAGAYAYRLRAEAALAEELARIGNREESIRFAERAREALDSSRSVEHADVILLTLANAYRILGKRELAAICIEQARRVVDDRFSKITDASLRRRYSSTGTFRAVRASAHE